MSKEDIVKREITFKSDDYENISAIRYRDSSGHGFICLRVGQEELRFHNTPVRRPGRSTCNFGDEYGQVALEAARILEQAADEGCELKGIKINE